MSFGVRQSTYCSWYRRCDLAGTPARTLQIASVAGLLKR